MLVHYSCPHCQQTVGVEAQAIGQALECPACRRPFQVPAPPAVIAATLPYSASFAEPSRGLAIASLVLGICGIFTCGLTGLIGIIFGIVACARAIRDPSRWGGKGLAIGGIAAGAAALLFFGLVTGLSFLPALSRPRTSAKKMVCAANMQTIGVALEMYAADYGVFPNSLQTLVDTGAVTPSTLICPGSQTMGGYTLVPSALPNPSMQSRDSKIVVLYEACAHHRGEGANVLFQDGHVSFADADQLGSTLIGGGVPIEEAASAAAP